MGVVRGVVIFFAMLPTLMGDLENDLVASPSKLLPLTFCGRGKPLRNFGGDPIAVRILSGGEVGCRRPALGTDSGDWGKILTFRAGGVWSKVDVRLALDMDGDMVSVAFMGRPLPQAHSAGLSRGDMIEGDIRTEGDMIVGDIVGDRIASRSTRFRTFLMAWPFSWPWHLPGVHLHCCHSDFGGMTQVPSGR